MRHLIRRMTLLPAAVAVAPLLYVIAWMLAGHREAVDAVKDLVSDGWHGIR